MSGAMFARQNGVGYVNVDASGRQMAQRVQAVVRADIGRCGVMTGGGALRAAFARWGVPAMFIPLLLVAYW